MPFYPVLYTLPLPVMSYKNKQINTTPYKKQTNYPYTIQHLLLHTNNEILYFTKNNKPTTPHDKQNNLISNARTQPVVAGSGLAALSSGLEAVWQWSGSGSDSGVAVV